MTIPSEPQADNALHRGLEQIVVAATAIGSVRGKEGYYHYRQYSAIECVEQCSFEDIWFLLFSGAFPTSRERTDFLDEVTRLQSQHFATVAAIVAAVIDPDQGNIMADVRTVLSAFGSRLAVPPILDQSLQEQKDTAMLFSALMPCIVTAVVRYRSRTPMMTPKPELGFASNYLYMMTGHIPNEHTRRAIEQYLSSIVEHGFNTSTFTARVVTSTGADMGAVLVAALSALSGPLHGGAPSRALALLDAIQDPAQAEQYVRDRIAAGEKIMGFGHRVYETEDPRSRMLCDVAASFDTPLAKRAIATESHILRTLKDVKPGRRINTNVEYYAGVVMECCGIPRHAFTATFLTGRTVGWCTHVLEQAKENRLIRPDATYIGPPPPVAIPASSRSRTSLSLRVAD